MNKSTKSKLNHQLLFGINHKNKKSVQDSIERGELIEESHIVQAIRINAHEIARMLLTSARIEIVRTVLYQLALTPEELIPHSQDIFDIQEVKSRENIWINRILNKQIVFNQNALGKERLVQQLMKQHAMQKYSASYDQ